MRGWLHAGMAPLVLVAGVVLIGLSPTAVTQAGATVFTVCSLTLFTSSATMHLRTGRWSPRAALLLKRLDHSSIYLLIAGTCTPVSILLLDGARQTAMLALAGRHGRRHRLPGLVDRGAAMALHPAVHPARLDHRRVRRRLRPPRPSGRPRPPGRRRRALHARRRRAGLRRPNPFPLLGFHEVFHALTVLAFVAHFTGVGVHRRVALTSHHVVLPATASTRDSSAAGIASAICHGSGTRLGLAAMPTSRSRHS